MNPTPDTSPSAGADGLHRALGQLPTHEPAPDTWARIEAQLAADAALPQLVAALPTHEPADEVWDSIASRLETPAAPLAHHRHQPSPTATLLG